MEVALCMRLHACRYEMDVVVRERNGLVKVVRDDEDIGGEHGR